ncbi:MAG: hypothetical protein ACRD23_18185 [Terriglobales bacterium]
MIFSIQTYIEDYFRNRGLDDPDQYAVGLARLYDRKRLGKSDAAFLAAMKNIRTIFYKRNDRVQRAAFDRKMLDLLDNKFKKKDYFSRQEQSQKELKPRAVA